MTEVEETNGHGEPAGKAGGNHAAVFPRSCHDDLLDSPMSGPKGAMK
jgi:hypothetical protein